MCYTLLLHVETILKKHRFKINKQLYFFLNLIPRTWCWGSEFKFSYLHVTRGYRWVFYLFVLSKAIIAKNLLHGIQILNVKYFFLIIEMFALYV